VVVEARFARTAAIFLVSPAGDGDEHHVASLRPANPLGHIVAVDLRQRDVEQHDLGREIQRLVDRFLAVVGHAHVVAQRLQEHGEAVGRVGVVVNHENAVSDGFLLRSVGGLHVLSHWLERMVGHRRDKLSARRMIRPDGDVAAI